MPFRIDNLFKENVLAVVKKSFFFFNGLSTTGICRLRVFVAVWWQSYILILVLAAFPENTMLVWFYTCSIST